MSPGKNFAMLLKLVCVIGSLSQQPGRLTISLMLIDWLSDRMSEHQVFTMGNF